MRKLFTKNLTDKHQFMGYMKFDNVEPVTLCPTTDSLQAYGMERFVRYCLERGIDYYLVEEKAGRTHYHGLISYPNGPSRKKFQVWFNKNYGKYHKSEKGEEAGWYWYCHKDVELVPEQEQNLHPQDFMNAGIFDN